MGNIVFMPMWATVVTVLLVIVALIASPFEKVDWKSWRKYDSVSINKAIGFKVFCHTVAIGLAAYFYYLAIDMALHINYAELEFTWVFIGFLGIFSVIVIGCAIFVDDKDADCSSSLLFSAIILVAYLSVSLFILSFVSNLLLGLFELAVVAGATGFEALACHKMKIRDKA